MVLKDENSLFQPISGNFSADILNQPRQSFPDVYVPNGYIDIVKSSTILNENKLHGTKILFESPFVQKLTLKTFQIFGIFIRKR